MKKVLVDFESYYDGEISVTTQGLKNYVEATYPYLVSVVTDDMEFCGTPAECGQILGDSWFKDPQLNFVAANSNFDQALWEKTYGKTARDWSCVLDHAAYHQLPRDLANISRVLLKHKVDKSVRDKMKGVHYDSLPDAEKQQVLDYCLMDSIVAKQADDLLAPMSPVEERIAAHTRMCNRRGVHIDVAKVERDKTFLERIHHDAHRLIPWTKEGAAPLSYPAFAAWCATQGVNPPASLDKRDAACNAWIAANPGPAKVL